MFFNKKTVVKGSSISSWKNPPWNLVDCCIEFLLMTVSKIVGRVWFLCELLVDLQKHCLISKNTIRQNKSETNKPINVWCFECFTYKGSSWTMKLKTANLRSYKKFFASFTSFFNLPLTELHQHHPYDCNW